MAGARVGLVVAAVAGAGCDTTCAVAVVNWIDMAPATVGEDYYNDVASGASGDWEYEDAGGELPDGLELFLFPADAGYDIPYVHGVPTESGTFEFEVLAREVSCVSRRERGRFTLEVRP